MKLKAWQVEDDQWICPVVGCMATLHDDDIAAMGGSALLAKYKKRCPICLDDLPVIGLSESTQQTPETHVKLACRHKFCTQCLLAYVEMKLKARQVEDDQWICPVVECKATLHDDDIAAIGGSALLTNYKKTLQRVRIPFLSNWVAGRYIHQALGYMGIAVTTYIICRFGFFAFVGSLFALRVTVDLTDWAIATARQHRHRL
ncbi:hypothetical protein P43SY_006614 [Pythium insidiosum]|uniref:RING-type domain-containing protein n=1 Tax=Pythium insidiosum TaxID=114742 RepID=A0AAD5LJR0_PYTIN|nr:hypothetical protein P43SY_006614 [Pythium insidiosum]